MPSNLHLDECIPTNSEPSKYAQRESRAPGPLSGVGPREFTISHVLTRLEALLFRPESLAYQTCEEMELSVP